MTKSLRRLQVSVVFISMSFFTRATIYILLAVGFMGEPLSESPCLKPDIRSPYFMSHYLCDTNYASRRLIRVRSFLGSPLVIPLFTLVSDPLVMMCAVSPPPSPPRTHPLRSPNHLNTPRCIMRLFRAALPPSSCNCNPCAVSRIICRRATSRSKTTTPKSTSPWPRW